MVMEFEADRGSGGGGLLANGSSRLWDVAVEEALDRDKEWSLEIDGPTVYLVLQLHDLDVISKAVGFLDERLNGDPSQRRLRESAAGESLLIGRFGQTSVELVWDNEEAARCFLVIGPRARSTVRLTLQEDDVNMLLEALRQVAEDLGETALPSAASEPALTAKTG
jgi:hypothetical protein